MAGISRGLSGAIGLGAMTLVAGASALAQRAPLPAECRQQLVAHCGAVSDRRACIRSALPKLGDECRKAISDRRTDTQPLTSGMTEFAYGPDKLQKLDLIAPAGGKRPPLVLFVHGGGWSIGDKRNAAGSKAAHFTAAEYAFAIVNYRLVPQATVEQQAADIAAAVAFLRTHAAKSNYDPDRIILMGHSAGAHLAALVGTDPYYLAAARVPLGAVKGVILLDGAGYDIARKAADPQNSLSSMYHAAFGTDPARQARLSPTRHAPAPNVANWLILPIERRADSTAQSQALAAGLIKAGAKASVIAVRGESHGSLNQGFGEAGDFATAKVDAFLTAL